jgi:RNA recognition motif-containing protein
MIQPRRFLLTNLDDDISEIDIRRVFGEYGTVSSGTGALAINMLPLNEGYVVFLANTPRVCVCAPFSNFGCVGSKFCIHFKTGGIS